MNDNLTGVGVLDHHKLRVVAKEVAAEGVVSLVLADPDGGDLPAWSPGAHLDLVLGQNLIRQYSLCGAVTDRRHLRVAVLREPEGRGGSQSVHDDVAVGDLIAVKGPRNNFPLVDAPAYLFVAGGIGITPLKPMIAEVDGCGAEWTLLYGGRTAAGMAFADVLAQEYSDRVQVRPQDEHGLLDLDAALDAVSPGTAVYCCGPEPLLAALEEKCRSRGVELHLERFSPKSVPSESDSPGDAFEVVLHRSGRTVTVGADETVLDALLRDGVEVDFSCREGTCGTCEQTVLDGVPDHRDSVLDDDEQAANDCMMVCVSRSCSARLVLDL
ncbi:MULTISPECIES: PDR/VanB family oxidoreductase [Gordonia]|uniref:PDR/VanB family oxidoreductase n=1 Tax=Gordonia amicalis TaxID=89053 RepID=A0ABU4DDX5_9ACTN|nr:MULTISPECIES: PDR/VanB family oxidoreductase [Gordonia]ATD69381.1 oxidoreductase [Gordonia sp. 1D]KAF0971113.1 Phenoxybenzoate dioxygenase subunit beta [Gordonia sp. YY1]MCR8898093.1 PDR/VanB family oxidoreductase [Gordonia sp. GONU]MCZ4650146.1 PDR/VanB family oxidoreductase [Gordonia amicalis]MDJ0451895.1 PDR/VanB family oxidoreductase [Gordonia amicalis]